MKGFIEVTRITCDYLSGNPAETKEEKILLSVNQIEIIHESEISLFQRGHNVLIKESYEEIKAKIKEAQEDFR